MSYRMNSMEYQITEPERTAAEMQRLRAENERLRQDAERLNWIERAADRRKVELARSILQTGYEIAEWSTVYPTVRATVTKGTLRDAIDAAMKASGSPD